MSRSKIRKILLVIGGIACLVIGIIGIFLPILPTTVFLLLAAAAFARSSDRLYNWIMNHRLFGALIRNYRLYHAVPVQTKVVTLAFLWLTIGSTILFAINLLWLRVLLLAIAAGVTWHILALKTLTPAMQAEFTRLEVQQKTVNILDPS